MADNTIVTTLQLKAVMDISDVRSNAKAIQNSLSKLKLPDKMSKSLAADFDKLESKVDKYQNKLAAGIKTTGDVTSLEKMGNEINNLMTNIANTINSIDDDALRNAIQVDLTPIKNLQDELQKVKLEISDKVDFSGLIDDINTKLRAKIGTKNAVGREGGLLDQLVGSFNKGDLAEIDQALTQLEYHIARYGNMMGKDSLDALNKFTAEARASYNQISVDVSGLEKEQERLNAEVNKFKDEKIRQGADAYRNNERAIAGAVDQTRNFIGTTNEAIATEQSLNQQVKNLQSQINSFFGIDQVLRKVIDLGRQAFQTVKDLDAAMTETAVVTDFSVGDMWNMLPTYTEQANQLGSTIQDVYEAATLYYQQGLNTSQAMALANETLKMARIGGIDAAEATNMMTAALRGFNMQINETSAKRINDVYSELAAITASDTQEIGSAMERTASIASSANMEFETTSAFLAQMIETTREAPENLGTAMKTIVARFQEMKQDPTKLVDSEGVAMDVNKVDKALKTIGVSLTNTKGEFRDLDDVFLDISAKWDTLTQGQKRYIATIAAGSRQQSRFIAMMSNHERTMELVEAANDSAGASQLQFEKTLESLDSKLNQLKNAWNQYIMGLMNNDIIKFGVDAVTKFFTIVNKVTDLLTGKLPDPFSGITKSVITLAGTMGGLLATGKLVRKLLTGFVAFTDPKAGGFSNAIKAMGMDKSTTQSVRNALSKYRANKGQIINIRASLDLDTKEAIKKINELTPNSKISSLTKSLSGLNAAQTQGLMQNIPAIEQTLNSGIEKVLQSSKLDDTARQEGRDICAKIVQGMKEGTVTFDEGIDQINQELSQRTGTNVNINNRAIGAENVKNIKDQSQALSEMGNKLTTVGSNLRMFGDALRGTPLEPFGNAISMLGTVLLTFGSIAAQVAAKVSAAITAASTASTGAVKVFFSTLLGPQGLIILGIIAGIVALIYIIKKLDDAFENDKEKLENNRKAAAEAAQAYDSAKQALSELKETLDTISDNENAFDGLVAGTLEWKQAMIEANSAILDLLDKYPQLAEQGFVTTDKNGLMHVSQEGLNSILEYQQDLVSKASAISAVRTGEYNAGLKDKEARQLEKEAEKERDNISAQGKLERANLLRQSEEIIKEEGYNTALSLTLSSDLRNKDIIVDFDSANFGDTLDDIIKGEVAAMDQSQLTSAIEEIYGWTYNKKEKAFYNGDEQMMEYDETVVKRLVGTQKALEQAAEGANTLDRIITEGNKYFEDVAKNAGFEGLRDVFSGLLTKNSTVSLGDLINIQKSGEDEESFADTINSYIDDLTKSGKLESTVKAFQLEDEEELATFLQENFKNLIEARATAYADLTESLIRSSGLTDGEDFKNIVESLEGLTEQQFGLLSSSYNSIAENMSIEAADLFVDGFVKLKESLPEEDFKKFFDIFDSVSWESATSRLEAYNKGLESTNDTINTLSASLKEMDANVESEALLEVWNSEDFSEVIEDIDELRNSAGKIDASKVKELASESHTLNRYLEASGTSASQFAAIMNALTGDLNIDLLTLNDRILNIIKSMGQVEGMISENHSFIENFDLGIDTGEATDFIAEQYKAMKELYDNGELGNEQLENYIQSMFGDSAGGVTRQPGNLAQYLGAGMKQAALYEDTTKGWTHIIDEYRKGSGKIYKAFKAAHIEAGYADDGTFKLDVADDFALTTEQFVNAISEATGMSKEWAQLYAEDYMNYSAELRDLLEQNDQAAALKEYMTDIGNAEFVSEEEIKQIGELFGESAEKELRKKLGKKGINPFSLTDEDGNLLSGSEIYQSIGKKLFQSGQLGKVWSDKAPTSASDFDRYYRSGRYDLQQMMQLLSSNGVTDRLQQIGTSLEYAKENGLTSFQYGSLGAVDITANDTAETVAAKLDELEKNPVLLGHVEEILEGVGDISDAAAAIRDKVLGITPEGDDDGDNNNKNNNNSSTSASMGGTAEQYKADTQQRQNSTGKTRWSGAVSETSDEEYEEERKQRWSNFKKKIGQFFKNLLADPGLYEIPTETVNDTVEEVAEIAGEKTKEGYDNAEPPQVETPSLPTLNNASSATVYLSNLSYPNTGTSTATTDFDSANATSFNQTLTETKELIDSIPETKNFKINSNIKEVEESARNLNISSDSTQVTLSVNDEARDVISSTLQLAYRFGQETQTITLTANSASADATINRLSATTFGVKTIPIRLNLIGSTADKRAYQQLFGGSGRVATLNVNANSTTTGAGSGASGLNVPSYAKGKNNWHGGLSLTGELGYEIAWLPSEQRAMIVGMNGPQLVNLPSDAVVYPHEMSEDIIKQKGIPLGSFPVGLRSAGNTRKATYNTISSTAKKTTTKQQTASKETKQIVQTTGQISSRIYTINRQLESLNREIDDSSDKISKALEAVGDFVYSNISADVSSQVKKLNQIIEKNTDRKAIYKSIIDNLVTKDGKEGGHRDPYTGINYDYYEISFESGEENKTSHVNLASYVKFDKTASEYVIDEAALRAVAANPDRGLNEAIAIREALEKELADLYSEYYGADDNIKNAKKQLEDLTKQLQDTLFGWENELTKIAKLQNNLSMKESYQSILDSESELILARLGAGFTSLAAAGKQYSKAMKTALDATTSTIKLQAKIVKENINQYNRDLSIKDERDAFASARAKLSKMNPNSGEYQKQKALTQQLREEYIAARMARRYVSTTIDKNGQRQVNIDYGAIEAARRSGNMTETEYQAIKEYYEKLVDEVNTINEGVANIKSSITELYTQYLEQYSMMSDYTQKIASGMESRDQETVDKLEELNNNLQEAFSELIDKVKESIDAQRQAEENQKTEQDITDQMNRLAILRANTSGGNASEIAQLEKSIREATGNYEDSLEDQMLEHMQQQADAASKQRERQIKIMTNQLNQSKSQGVYIARAERMVQRIADGKATKAMLHEALSYYLGTEPIDKWGRQYQTGQFNQDTAQVQNFNSTINQLKNRIKSLEETLKETNKELKKGKNTKSLSNGLGIKDVKAEGLSAAWALKQGYSGKEVAKTYGLNAGQMQKMINKYKSDKDVNQKDLAGLSTSFGTKGAPKKGTVGKNGLTVAANQGSVLYVEGIKKKTGRGNGKLSKYTTAQLTPELVKNNPKESGEAILAALQKKAVGSVVNKQWTALLNAISYSKLKKGSKVQLKDGLVGKIIDNGYISFKDSSGILKYWDPGTGAILSAQDIQKRIKKKPDVPAYIRGGLSTQTGPAWLDGTKTKPEIVLNATDTKNFLALRAALEDTRGTLGSVIESNNEYNTSYEINITVESIANDYDVDQMVERVRRSILKESRGTNVTSVIRRK